MMIFEGFDPEGLGIRAALRDNLATLEQINSAEGGTRLTVLTILNTRCINHKFADVVGAIADVRT